MDLTSESVLSLATEDDYPLWELHNAIVGIDSDPTLGPRLVAMVEKMIEAGVVELMIGTPDSKVSVRKDNPKWRSNLRDPRYWRLPSDNYSDQLFLAATARGRQQYFGREDLGE